jgi:hypothetical protein
MIRKICASRRRYVVEVPGIVYLAQYALFPVEIR